MSKLDEYLRRAREQGTCSSITPRLARTRSAVAVAPRPIGAAQSTSARSLLVLAAGRCGVATTPAPSSATASLSFPEIVMAVAGSASRMPPLETSAVAAADRGRYSSLPPAASPRTPPVGAIGPSSRWLPVVAAGRGNAEMTLAGVATTSLATWLVAVAADGCSAATIDGRSARSAPPAVSPPASPVSVIRHSGRRFF
jgi:hypothetical protein